MSTPKPNNIEILLVMLTMFVLGFVVGRDIARRTSPVLEPTPVHREHRDLDRGRYR